MFNIQASLLHQIKIFSLFLLLPLHLLAQDISGVWTGYIQTLEDKVSYEIAISETKEGYSGYAMSIFMFNGTENIGVKTIKLKEKKGIIALEDDELVYDNFSTPAKRSKLYGSLVLKVQGSIMTLGGTFTTRSLDFRDKRSYSGSILLQRQNNLENSKLVAKLEELNKLNTLSFAKTKPERKEETAIVAADVKKSSPPPATPEEKAVVQQPTVDKGKNENTATEETTVEKKVVAAPAIRKASPVKEPQRKENRPQPALAQSQPVALQKEKGNNPSTEVASRPAANKVADKADDKAIAPPAPEQKKVATITPVPKKSEVAGPSASEIAARKTEVIRSVFFNSDSLVLTLYDNGTIDGDTVSVVVNGRVIIGRKGLNANAIKETIYLASGWGDSLQLIMYAENLGSIPPNTGLLIIQDGTDRHEIRFEGDLQKSSAVILRRRR